MTSFILKIIAILSMTCDHCNNAITGKYSIFTLLGRIAFPIFAFQLSIGYSHTKDLKKYFIRLLVFAFISQIPYMLFMSTYSDEVSLNVFFTFLLGLCALFLFDKCPKKIFGFLIVIVISIIAELINVDYGAFGILSIFLFHFFKDDKIKLILPYIALCFGKYIVDIIQSPLLYETYLKLAIFTIIPILFISFYNGKQGPKAKYLFYIYYPLHLLILWIVHTLI